VLAQPRARGGTQPPTATSPSAETFLTESTPRAPLRQDHRTRQTSPRRHRHGRHRHRAAARPTWCAVIPQPSDQVGHRLRRDRLGCRRCCPRSPICRSQLPFHSLRRGCIPAARIARMPDYCTVGCADSLSTLIQVFEFNRIPG
jgi:hypothetical protein